MRSAPPAILLLAPQLGENIGAAARAMGNFGLTDLRIIAPRDGWPNPAAVTMSAGALETGLVQARLFDTLEAASADLALLIATTARQRGMEKPVADAAGGVARLQATPVAAGVLFGAEKSGLPNEAILLADLIMTYPVDPAFPSLNLGQAVGIFAHAWGAASHAGAPPSAGVGQPATKDELVGMCEHFEAELERAGFFFPPEKHAVMVQNLRNAFARAGWTAQEVRTFRGAIKALALGRGKARIVREE